MSVDQICEDNIRLANHIACQATDLDFPEAFSAAMEGLERGARSFEPSRNVPLGAWLGRKISFAIGDVRKHKRHCGRNLNHSCLDELSEVLPAHDEWPDRAAMRRDDEQRLMRAIAGLSDRERSVMAGVLAGLAYKPLAEKHHVTEAMISLNVKSALHKLREALC